jgi:hypothetical protein
VEVKFVLPADEELDEAICYYNLQQTGLGDMFFDEVNKTLERIKEFPFAWTKIGSHTRRCLLNKFPYSLMYVVEEDVILIVAVAHQHREPSYYCDRIRP